MGRSHDQGDLPRPPCRQTCGEDLHPGRSARTPECRPPSMRIPLWGRPPLEAYPLDTDPPDADPLEADPPWDATGYGQQAGSTHPTGMHSCCHLSLTSKTSDKWISLLLTSQQKILIDLISMEPSNKKRSNDWADKHCAIRLIDAVNDGSTIWLLTVQTSCSKHHEQNTRSRSPEDTQVTVQAAPSI